MSSAQRVSHTYGKPLCTAGAKGKAVPSAQVQLIVSTTLATKAPQVAMLWDAKKNHPLSPDQVTVSSNMRAHWKCSVCLHEWQAPVFIKTVGKTGCPNCAKANPGWKALGRSTLLLQ